MQRSSGDTQVPGSPYPPPGTRYFVAPDTQGLSYPGYWNPGVPYATWFTRLIAYLLDCVPLLAVSLMPSIWYAATAQCEGAGYPCASADLPLGITVPLNGASSVEIFFSQIVVLVIASVIVCLMVFVGWPLFWAWSGQTIGQHIMRIRVIGLDGNRLGYPRALMRALALVFLDEIVFGLPLGELWHFVDPKRRTWHDLVAGSVVIKVTHAPRPHNT